jgi:hypothetical protein
MGVAAGAGPNTGGALLFGTGMGVAVGAGPNTGGALLFGTGMGVAVGAGPNTGGALLFGTGMGVAAGAGPNTGGALLFGTGMGVAVGAGPNTGGALLFGTGMGVGAVGCVVEPPEEEPPAGVSCSDGSAVEGVAPSSPPLLSAAAPTNAAPAANAFFIKAELLGLGSAPAPFATAAAPRAFFATAAGPRAGGASVSIGLSTSDAVTAEPNLLLPSSIVFAFRPSVSSSGIFSLSRKNPL